MDAAITGVAVCLSCKTYTVSTGISGVRFELVAACASSGPSASTTVTVASNTDGLNTSLKCFVDSYN
ncbi:flagellar filament capping protein FliD, partial [Pseudomonas syringae group genomosp. 7]|uniref:flagellar filament capping protein FliD n=1 Tax=Pseudomonas syringae group genomosp. 7 TaxID=251699 RepID=UPI00376FD138